MRNYKEDVTLRRIKRIYLNLFFLRMRLALDIRLHTLSQVIEHFTILSLSILKIVTVTRGALLESWTSINLSL